MSIKKNLLATLAIVIFGLTPVVAVVPAYAATQTTNTNHPNFFGFNLDGFVQFLAQKFGLDQNQVKTAVTDYKNQQKQQMQQNMQNRQKARLDGLVSTGKITQDQETAIINELNSLKNDPSLQGKTQQQKMQFISSGFTTWAKSQNIDPTLIMPFGGMRGMGMMGKWHRGFRSPTVTPTPTQ